MARIRGVPESYKYQSLPKPQDYKKPSPEYLTHCFNEYKARAVDTHTDDVHTDASSKD